MNGCQFTAQDLANVFLARWQARDLANEFLGYARTSIRLAVAARPKVVTPQGHIKFAPRLLKEWK